MNGRRAVAYGILGIALLLAPPGAAGESDPPEDRILEALPLEDLSVRERERIVDGVRRLYRLHGAAGDGSRGEVGAYVDGVDELARYLKRETVEESRRLLTEASLAFERVDRRWIDQAFAITGNADFPVTDQSLGVLRDQADKLRAVGELLKEEQEIVARQKALAAGAERRYRDILRIQREAHRVFDGLGHEGIRSALRWLVDEIDRTGVGVVRPAHDRQQRLLGLFDRVVRTAASGPAGALVKDYREYSSKVRVIERRVREARADAAGSD